MRRRPESGSTLASGGGRRPADAAAIERFDDGVVALPGVFPGRGLDLRPGEALPDVTDAVGLETRRHRGELLGCEAGQVGIGRQIAAAVLANHRRSDAVANPAMKCHVGPGGQDRESQPADGKHHGER